MPGFGRIACCCSRTMGGNLRTGRINVRLLGVSFSPIFPIFEAYIYVCIYAHIYSQQLFGDLCLLDFGCCCPQRVYLGLCVRWLFRHLRLLFVSKQHLLGHLCLLSLWLLLSAVRLLGDLVVCLWRRFRFSAWRSGHATPDLCPTSARSFRW